MTSYKGNSNLKLNLFARNIIAQSLPTSNRRRRRPSAKGSETNFSIIELPSLIPIAFTFGPERFSFPIKTGLQMKILILQSSFISLFGRKSNVSRGHLKSVIFLWKFYDDCSFSSPTLFFNVSTFCFACDCCQNKQCSVGCQDNLLSFDVIKLINGVFVAESCGATSAIISRRSFPRKINKKSDLSLADLFTLRFNFPFSAVYLQICSSACLASSYQLKSSPLIYLWFQVAGLSTAILSHGRLDDASRHYDKSLLISVYGFAR